MLDKRSLTYNETTGVSRQRFIVKEEKKFHDKVVEFVEDLQNTQRELIDAKTDHEKNALQRQIDATDNEIDRLVYQLYGLTEEEIKIIENSGNQKA